MTSTVKIYDVGKPKINLSTWQIVALGAIPVVGLGVWWYFKTNDSKKGITPQENGIDLSQKLVKAQNQASKSHLKKEDKETNVEAPKTPLQRAQSLKNSGNEFFKEKKFAEAIRCYSEAIDLCPRDESNVLSTFYQNRAACYDMLNSLPEMVKDCSAALELNPRYEKALSRRAKAFQTLGKLDECLEDVTALCILENFKKEKSLEMANDVLKELGKKHAKEAIKTKKPVELSSHFVKSYFTSFPNDPVVNASDFKVVEVNSTESDSTLSHLERAKSLLLRGRYREVVPACTEAIEQGEGSEPEALLLRATMYLLQGLHPPAMEDLNTIINSQVQNHKITVNALIKRASLYLQLEEKEKTYEDLDAAEKIDPDIPDLYLHRGQVNLLMENVDESIKDFKKCASLDPDFPIALMQGHYAEYRKAFLQKDGVTTGIAKAIEKFKRDIRKFPKCSEGYVLLAQVLVDQQQYDEADKCFLTAIEQDPGNAALRVHRGLLLLQWKGDIDNAVKLINEGIKVDERCSLCYETLGTIEVQRANLKLAIKMFDKAIPLSKTEMELSHLFSLRDAAIAQQAVAEKLGLFNQLAT